MDTLTVKILRGIPGAGKSTYQKSHMPKALVCSADHYFMDAQGQYKFDGRKLGDAHSECLLKFQNALQNRVGQVVVDNTNIYAIDVAPYYALAVAYGYKVTVVTIHVSPDVATRRQLHGVDDTRVRAMYDALNEQNSHFPARWSHITIFPDLSKSA